MHKGEQLHKWLKKSGYSLSFVATKMNMSRNTLYARLKSEYPPPGFIIQLEQRLRCNLVHIFPDINRPEYAKTMATIRYYEKAYIEVADRFAALLTIVAETALTIESPEVRHQIADFLKKNVTTKERIIRSKTSRL